MNIMKFGEHSYLPNGHQILILRNWTNVKLLCGFAKVGFKGVEIKLEHCLSWPACLSNGHAKL